jgi:hypothetical protein
MTQQHIYQAIVCVLRATQTISQQLKPEIQAQFRERIEALAIASSRALKAHDGKKLRTLCNEASHLGNDVNELL